MTKFEALQILGLTGHISNQDIKLAYKRKAKEFHPDRNPAGAEIMKMINLAYNLVKNEVDIEVTDDSTMGNYPEILSTALNAILHLELAIEICGLWIWVSGDTKPHKEELKKAGYLWSPKKGMWYYRPAKAKSRKYYGKAEEWNMDRIRDAFGAARPTRVNTKRIEH